MTSELTPARRPACQKCGGRMLQDQGETNEWCCFNCGTVFYVIPNNPPARPTRRIRHAGTSLD